jgi:hypothetical protein
MAIRRIMFTFDVSGFRDGVFGLAAWFWVVMVLAAPGSAAEETAVELPANLLGLAYVDLRHGFSVRAPLNYSLGATGRDDFPDLIDWDHLKLPASKRLVSFGDSVGQAGLEVYLLVTRKGMTIENLLAARESYWQTFPDQATLEETGTETVSSLPSAVTQLVWKGKKEGPSLRIRETVVQRKKNRYFMLVHMGAVGGEGNTVAVVDDAIAGNFVCMEESESKQRWGSARKSAQEVLESLDSAAVKLAFGDESYYRLRRGGEEVGFQCVRRNVHVLEDQKQHRFEIDMIAYADSAEVAEAYAEMVGWRASPVAVGENPSAFSGPVVLESHFQLDGDLKSEQFEYRAKNWHRPVHESFEKGHWRENMITIYPSQADEAQEKVVSKELQVTSKIAKIYLPLSLVDILGRFIKAVDGQEYVFARYFYRTVGFYSLRVVGKVDLKLEPLAVDGEKTKEDAKKIKALYLVGQLNSQGPITELWLDAKGQILRQKGPGIEWVRASREEIGSRWPKALAELLPDKTMKKATAK